MGTAVFGAPEFKARSGRTIRSNEDGSISFQGGNGYIGPGLSFDAEEFFQAKRDAELGRWRWPENPDYVVYPEDGGAHNVVRESTGLSLMASRDGIRFQQDPHADAARAYFEAHPERKPWQEAQPGEVWVIRYRGEESAWVAGRSDFAHLFEQAERSISKVHMDISEGRRIWPEDAS